MGNNKSGYQAVKDDLNDLGNNPQSQEELDRVSQEHDDHMEDIGVETALTYPAGIGPNLTKDDVREPYGTYLDEQDTISDEQEAQLNESLMATAMSESGYHTESDVEAVSNLMMASSELPADSDNTALDTITHNPDAYKPMGWQKLHTIEVSFMTDSVPGAWHDPEDMVRSILTNPYVQSVTLKG